MCEDVARTVHLRARSATPIPLDPRGHRRALRPLPERLRTALSARSPEPRPRADRPAGDHAGRSTTTCCPGITERQAGYAAERRRGARPTSPTSSVAAPVKERADAERAMRELEGRDLDGLLVVMLTYGPAMRVARAARGDAAADLPGQHPARPGGHRRVGHGRPDLQPGHPRRAGHRQRDGPRRPAVPRRHRRLARRLVPRRGRRAGRAPPRRSRAGAR